MNLAGASAVRGQLLRQVQADLATDFSTAVTASPGALMLTATMSVASVRSVIRIDAQILGVLTGSGFLTFTVTIDGGSVIAFSRSQAGATLELSALFALITGVAPGSHAFQLRAYTDSLTLSVTAGTTPTTRRASIAVAEYSPLS